MQDILAQFVLWLTDAIRQPPGSTIFVTVVSVLISSISNVAMKRWSDMRRLRRYQADISQFRALEKRARETGNEKLLRRVKKRKPYIDRIQREMMTARCKPMLIFFIPFMLAFSWLRTFYTYPDATSPNGLRDAIVAVIPFNLHKLLPFFNGFIGVPVAGGFGLWFWPFYFLVGLGLGQILQRIQGTQIMTGV